jgi:hypothetical protein
MQVRRPLEIEYGFNLQEPIDLPDNNDGVACVMEKDEAGMRVSVTR